MIAAPTTTTNKTLKRGGHRKGHFQLSFREQQLYTSTHGWKTLALGSGECPGELTPPWLWVSSGSDGPGRA